MSPEEEFRCHMSLLAEADHGTIQFWKVGDADQWVVERKIWKSSEEPVQVRKAKITDNEMILGREEARKIWNDETRWLSLAVET